VNTTDNSPKPRPPVPTDPVLRRLYESAKRLAYLRLLKEQALKDLDMLNHAAVKKN